MPQNTSEKLLNRYRMDCKTAPFEIHDRYRTRVVALARTRLMGILKSKVDPEDISQETFQLFFEMADRNEVRWHERGDLWRLLAGIAINKVKQSVDHYSAAKRDPRNEVPLFPATDSAAQEPALENAASELIDLVEHVLVAEKPLLKRVLAMRLAGFTFEEVGDRCGRSTRTIRRMLDSLKSKILADDELGSVLGLVNPRPTTMAREGNAGKIETVCYKDFQLLKMLGQGSFSKVYLARHVSTNQLYAIKAIRKKWLKYPKVSECFSTEIRLLMSIDDPHVVRTFGSGQLPNEGCFIVLEWINGTPLSSLIVDAEQSDRNEWWKQIQEAVEGIRTAGVVHGDLCSRNILVDEKKQIRIVDFGLGRQFDRQGLDRAIDMQALVSLKQELQVPDDDSPRRHGGE